MQILNKRNNILYVAIAIIIVTLLLIPTSSVIARNNIIPVEKKETLTIWMPGVGENDYLIQDEVTQNNMDRINLSCYDFLDVINITTNENSYDGINISGSEWDTIKIGIFKILEVIREVVGEDFPYLATLAFVDSLIEALRGPFYLVRQPVLSIGIGYTLIPFYEYETFIGKIIRPVFMRHLIGFSITARLNPFVLGFPYWYFGFQRVRTFLFNGLLINAGDLGKDRIIGPQLLIGYGIFTGLIH